jgi:hypothetical protein
MEVQPRGSLAREEERKYTCTNPDPVKLNSSDTYYEITDGVSPVECLYTVLVAFHIDERPLEYKLG